jgi:exonuclease III
MDSKKECDIDLGYIECENHATGRKMAEAAGEILKYGMDVVALQEIRWRGHDRVNKNNYSLFYSGPETRTGQYGTGIIINSKVKRSFLVLSL